MEKDKLAELGLMKVDAFIERSLEAPEQEKKKKQNAERQAKWRERQKEKGNKVGAVVPQAVADAAQAGKVVVAVTPEVANAVQAGKPLAPALSRNDQEALDVGRRALSLVGWRSSLVRWLLDL